MSEFFILFHAQETEAEKTIEKLRIENTSMKMKLSDLETLFKSSNNDKDKRLIAYLEEIRQLKALEHSGTGELTKSRQTLAALPTLREQLRAFARHCQDLEGELEKMEEIPKEVVTVSRHNSEVSFFLDRFFCCIALFCRNLLRERKWGKQRV